MTQTKIIQSLAEYLIFEEFIKLKPSEGLWELHDGVLVEMAQPKGKHEIVVSRIAGDLTLEFKRLNLLYGIPSKVLVKSAFNQAAYLPDVLLLNLDNLVNEPYWDDYSTVTLAKSIPLVIEVVSTNWRDDYYKKYGEYSGIGISEYWIIDYLGLGGKEFTGNPKQPTVTVCLLDDESEYLKTVYRGDEVIQSRLFPELKFSANYLFGFS
ncbi:MAG: Uma2 family endonuclease [Cyanobacteria bacterium P01_D01_bin.50]